MGGDIDGYVACNEVEECKVVGAVASVAEWESTPPTSVDGDDGGGDEQQKVLMLRELTNGCVEKRGNDEQSKVGQNKPVVGLGVDVRTAKNYVPIQLPNPYEPAD